MARSMLAALSVASAAALTPCSINISGKTLNFTSLINPAGKYTWNQTVFNTEGNLFSAQPDPSSATNYTYELQVCNAVTGSSNVNCTAGSMINQIGPDGSCLSFGSAAVANFIPNPYNDGAYIATYQGSQIDNVDAYSAHVYFICSQQAAPPTYEHMKATWQVHFAVLTPLAC